MTSNNSNLSSGIDLAKQGKCGESITAFKNIIREDSLCVDAWFNLSLSLNNEHFFREALFAIDHTLELSPDDKEAILCKRRIEENLLKINLPITYHANEKSAFITGLMAPKSNNQAAIEQFDDLNLNTVTVGDKAWVWARSRGGGFDYRVEITKISTDKVCVKDLSGKERRFRPFLAKKDFSQLSGSGRGTVTLSLKRVSGSEASAHELGVIL